MVLSRCATSPDWIAVCDTDRLMDGQRVTVDLPSGGRCLVLVIDGAYYAVSATCTHRSLSLDGGVVVGSVLVCPWHRARFDLAAGTCTRPAREPLRTYEVAVYGGVLCVRDARTAR
jgi:nitrite reductase/ring-hydroxylating ferredoxin subunit